MSSPLKMMIVFLCRKTTNTYLYMFLADVESHLIEF